MWLAAADLAGLPGLPTAEFRVRERAQREGWRARLETDRDGPGRPGYVYHLLSLPAAARAAVLDRLVEEAPSGGSGECPLPGPPLLDLLGEGDQEAGGAPALPTLADWQRRVMDARAALLGELDRLAAAMGRTAAAQAMVALARDGGLGGLQSMVQVANARSGAEVDAARAHAPTRRGFAASTSPASRGGGKRALSERTLRRWAQQREEHGVAGLAPVAPAARAPEVPHWAPHLLRLYRRPSKPSLRTCLALLPQELPGGIAPPSYDQARRWLSGLSTVERERGRLGPQAHKAVRGYVARDASMFDPLDIITADGHTADFRAQHPTHGQPFRPELTAVLDVRTRLAIGWSAGLSETAFGVMDALRSAVERCGIPTIFYTDRGPGFKGSVISDALTGLLARLGCTPSYSLPENSQARGRMERAHQSLWIGPARHLPAYCGRDMDRQAAKRWDKLTARDLQAHGSSALLMSWPETLAWCQHAVDEYNARPHSALPRVRDPESGRMRHQSPAEAWQAAVDAGWQPRRLAPGEAETLFRPHEIRTTRRGLVNLGGGTYYARDLEDWGGERVQVAYDVRDPSRVWVADLEGRPICEAALDGHVQAYMPASMVRSAQERQADQRARRRLQVVDRRRGEIEAERTGTVIELRPAPPALSEEERAEARARYAALTAEPEPPASQDAPGGRPAFGADIEFYRWLLDHPQEATDSDWRYIEDACASSWALEMQVQMERQRRGLAAQATG